MLDACNYTLEPSGNRIRSCLVYATGPAIAEVSNPSAKLDFSATAIELFHTYLLIHDDLTSMDDDLRRDKATAILVGGSGRFS